MSILSGLCSSLAISDHPIARSPNLCAAPFCYIRSFDRLTMSNAAAPTFQEVILRLQEFWAKRGCVLQQPYDVEVGAGTMAPETFLRVLGPRPYKVAYVQPSRRPADGRYGENPNRLYKHMQLQVILKPPPENVQELYLESLEAIGIE